MPSFVRWWGIWSEERSWLGAVSLRVLGVSGTELYLITGSEWRRSREAGGPSLGHSTTCRRGRVGEGTRKGDQEGTAGEIGREVSEGLSGNQGGSGFSKERVSNSARSAAASSQVSTNSSQSYCLHSWFYWLKRCFYHILYLHVCKHMGVFSLLSHWSVYPPRTTWSLKPLYVMRQAPCKPPFLLLFSLPKTTWLF